MGIREENAVFGALQKFADAVATKMSTLIVGEPEDQLRSPLEDFMTALGQALSRRIICTGETKLPGRLGKPDYAVHAGGVLVGYVELKAPGLGADPDRFSGHNRDQWKRFSALPNLIYCDGNEWGLYRSGQAVRPVVRLSGDLVRHAKKAVRPDDARALVGLLMDFLSWQPIVPTSKGKIDLRGLAAAIAPLCRMLRLDVTDALKDPQSPLVQLARDWRQLLFPEADDDQFADAYAQTVIFALLLARSEGAHPLTLQAAQNALAAEHTLLSRALQVLTDPAAQAEISASLNMTLRVIGAVPCRALLAEKDPWLYFYEDFLAVYDPKLRKDIGAYYTPVEVVRAQVRLIDDLLTNRLGKPLGFADPGVVTLDPAAGTGTYLLGVIEQALGKAEARLGPGALPGQATALANNLYGFEIMVGPYAVCELRVSRALRDRGGTLPKGGTHIYLTDTLESPDAKPPHLGFYLKPIADQHAKALEVKSNVPVIVCLGNPPYDRHGAADPTNLARTGGWVRYGDPIGQPAGKRQSKKKVKGKIRSAEAEARMAMREREQRSLFYKDFLKPAILAGHGVDVKNLYNLYVYFWRWALWKVFEHTTASGPGVVSYISASSYLDGDAFCGMREHMRRLCDEIWILDLGGEGRGTRKSENVFAIQTPVVIAVAARFGQPDPNTPARVHYARITGTRDRKLQTLDAVADFDSLGWEECPDDWQAPFRPAGKGRYFRWPLLTDLFPWQHSGVQFKRTWPICADPATLKARWKALLAADDKATALKETRDRKIGRTYPPLAGQRRRKPIEQLGRSADVPPIKRYAYRSFDRQWILADTRLGDFLRPDLWAAHSDRQLYLTSLLTKPLGTGPALTACSTVPDLDHFSGRGAKDVVPLYRDGECAQPNILPGLLELLARTYKKKVSAEDFVAYVYGILAHPAFTERYAEELATRELRVPITKDAALFRQVRDVGAKLLWLHTYGQRYVPKGRHRGQVPRGQARCTRPVPGDKANYPDRYEYYQETQTLHVGAGQFAPVRPEVYNFEVSGLKVVQSWLGYRMKNPKGKKSSPLDDIRPERWTSEFTTELLELLWVLEATIAEYPRQAKLLAAVARRPTIRM